MSGSTTDIAAARWELIRPIPRTAKLRLAGEILVSYARVRWLLWRADVPTAVAALRGAAPQDEGADERRRLREQAIGVRLGRAVNRLLGGLPFDSRCLVQSLVLTRLLARRGIPSTFVIGVRVKPEFLAHAWVESRGVALLPPLENAESRLLEL
jgi:hypothetical protein